MKLPRFIHAVLVTALFSGTGAMSVADGPTPYPDPKDEAAWPGVGPIRLGAWMNDNRAYSWTQRAADQGAVVFVGDSLIGGWKGLRAAFPELKVANRGIGGDVTRGTLFRFQEDVLDLNPKAVVFCTGTNDLSTHTDPANAVANLSLMVDLARKANPKLPIVICTIPPRNAPKSPIKPGALQDLNARISAFGAGKDNLVVVDLFTALATPEGTPNPEFIREDGIHISPAGYEKFAALLRPAFATLNVK
jgi:lysophospholipase L1-like esterase